MSRHFSQTKWVAMSAQKWLWWCANPWNMRPWMKSEMLQWRMRQCASVIHKLWPNKKKELTSEIMQYSTFRDRMTVQDGVVYKGQRAAIPKFMQEEIKKRSHSFHLGVGCSIIRAWVGIKDYILSCEVCQKDNHAQLKEPIMPDPQPQYPWERVSTVIMEYKSWSFLVTADYFRNLWELDELTCTLASAVIWKHKAYFTRCGTWTAVLWQRSSACKHWIHRICHTVAIHTEHKSRSCPIQ